ncbi:MAG: diguanylate cyclase [Gammaproteobacteria bacterium]|nr:MAG: diguanylate cyclase [Gammaproteobacteria bacterium]
MLNKLTLGEATTLLDTCPLALLLITDDGQLHGYNDAFAALLGDAATELVNSAGDIRSDSLLAPLLGQDTLINWVMPDGDERWLAVETTIMNGLTARYYQDVTEKLRLKRERDNYSRELKDLTLQDERLTSLLNRRGILVSLDPLVARSRRYNSPLSVIVMGLQADRERDKALVKVSYLLKDQTRWADLVGCNADQDFILILQETTQDAALLLVDKLSGQLARMSEGQPDALTACYGITACQKNDNAEEMLGRAEAALQEARTNQSGTAIAV